MPAALKQAVQRAPKAVVGDQVKGMLFAYMACADEDTANTVLRALLISSEGEDDVLGACLGDIAFRFLRLSPRGAARFRRVLDILLQAESPAAYHPCGILLRRCLHSGDALHPVDLDLAAYTLDVLELHHAWLAAVPLALTHALLTAALFYRLCGGRMSVFPPARAVASKGATLCARLWASQPEACVAAGCEPFLATLPMAREAWGDMQSGGGDHFRRARDNVERVGMALFLGDAPAVPRPTTLPFELEFELVRLLESRTDSGPRGMREMLEGSRFLGHLAGGFAPSSIRFICVGSRTGGDAQARMLVVDWILDRVDANESLRWDGLVALFVDWLRCEERCWARLGPSLCALAHWSRSRPRRAVHALLALAWLFCDDATRPARILEAARRRDAPSAVDIVSFQLPQVGPEASPGFRAFVDVLRAGAEAPASV